MPTGWKPRCALRVSVIGNRRFGDTDEQPTPAAEQMKASARAALDELWEALFASIDTALDYELPRTGSDRPLRMRDLFSDEPPRLGVLTSLAAGADQIGASTALEAERLQKKIDVELEAILPFAEEDYPGLPDARRSEFRAEEAEILRTLAAQASRIVRLNGDFQSDDSRKEGYAQARDLLLQNADIVIAVYRPNAPGGTAGTVESVERALQQHIPVIAVLLSERGARIEVLHSEQVVPEVDWGSGVQACVRGQLVLPEALAAKAVGTTKAAETFRHVRLRVALMSGAAEPPLLCRTPFTTIFGGVWSALQGIARTHASRTHTVRRDDSPPSDPTLQPYASFFYIASRLADAYMRTYRGAFVTSYLLASFAVVAAVAMMAASLLAMPEHPPYALMAFLCVVKVGILILLLGLEYTGRRDKWQEAGADFRYLTELLRPMEWLTPLGTYPPAVDLPLHTARHDARRSWMAWLARAAARSSPCVSATEECGTLCSKEIAITTEHIAATLDRARTVWLEGQAAYHERTAAQMHILEEGLEHVSKRLVWTVLIAAFIACVIELGPLSESLHGLTTIFGAIAAFLPAFIAAFAGISFQSEAKRLAMRYDAMYDALHLQQRELALEAQGIRAAGPRDSKSVSRAAAVLRRASKMTIAEAGDWKVFYQVHEVHAA